jgi:alkylation response protein AidB-like acyl-CoA dehydrogenase
MPIAEFGAPALRERLLPDMCAGKSVAANAMTEPDAGSDVSKLATTATPVDGGYLLNGTKSFVSNGPAADVFVTYATTDPAAGHFALTAFAVERRGGGVRIGEPFRKLGMASCPASQVTFVDCFVPDESILGERGQGSVVFQQSMLWERTCLFALYVGLQDRLIEQVIAHVKQRSQFGRPLHEFQSVSNRIVEMKLRLESGRLLLYRACWLLDRAEPDPLSSALSKLAVSEAALASATDAVQILAGRGYLAGHGVEAALRDSVGGTIFSGTSDIQRQIVARELGL